MASSDEVAQMQGLIDVFNSGRPFTKEESALFYRLALVPPLRAMLIAQTQEEAARRTERRRRLKRMWLETEEAREYRAEIEKHTTDAKRVESLMDYFSGLGTSYVESGQRIPQDRDLAVRIALRAPDPDLGVTLQFGEIVSRLDDEEGQR